MGEVLRRNNSQIMMGIKNNFYVVTLIRLIKELGIYSKRRKQVIQLLYDEVEMAYIDTPALLASKILRREKAVQKYLDMVMPKQCYDVALWLVKNGYEKNIENADYAWLEDIIRTFSIKYYLMKKYRIGSKEISSEMSDLFFGDILYEK